MSEYQSEKLNRQKIMSELTPENQRSLITLDLLAKTDSTNTYLIHKIKNAQESAQMRGIRPEINPGVGQVYICAAEEQTAGRGRQGKNWFSPSGRNIYCSIAMTTATTHDISQMSLAIAVILLDVLQKYGLHAKFQLKWPNDIYFNDRKLGGILIETAPAKKNTYTFIIGIGLNLNLPDQNPILKATDLSRIAGNAIKRNKLLGLLINEMLTQLPFYLAHGFVDSLKKWREHDMLLHKYIVVTQGKYIIPGIAQGINEQGELLVRDARGQIHVFRYGDVSVSFE